MAGLYTEEEALRIRHENYEKTQAFNEWQSMMLAQARPDRAAPILLSYCLPFVCRLSGEALPPLLPPELLSPRIASSSAFVYPYPIESSSSSS